MWYNVNMQLVSTVTQKGQATIPIFIREKLGIKPRSKISFEMNGEGEVLIKPVRDFLAMRGSLKTNKKSLSNRQLDDFVATSVAKEYATKLKKTKWNQ